jgi:hypothetical protein
LGTDGIRGKGLVPAEILKKRRSRDRPLGVRTGT